MIHTKDKDVITRTQALTTAFGWQGGTIHQVADETGCDAHDLIYASAEEWNTDYKQGWWAYRTCSLEHNQKYVSQNKGNLQFWLGVASGVQTTIKLKEQPAKKF